jgi:hypothetical protein
MEKIFKYATTGNIVTLFFLVLVVNVIFARSFAHDPDLSPLDLQFYYTADEAYDLLARFDAHDLQKYLLIELTLDMLYPVIYSLLFSFVLYLLYKNAKMAILPFVTAVFDVLENIGIVLLIRNLPSRLDFLASVTAVFTFLKWVTFIIVMALILVGILKWLVRRYTGGD